MAFLGGGGGGGGGGGVMLNFICLKNKLLLEKFNFFFIE